MELVALANTLKTFDGAVVFLSFVICIGAYFIRALSKGQKELEHKIEIELQSLINDQKEFRQDLINDQKEFRQDLRNILDKLDAKIDRVVASLSNDIKTVAHDLNNMDKAFIRFESKQNEKKIS